MTRSRVLPSGNQLAPSILDSDFAILGDTLRQLETSGVEIIHLDVMDGRFVPNISFGAPVVRSVRSRTNLFLDVHLMIEEPERHAEAFAEAGSDLVTVHVEATRHIHRTIQLIGSQGAGAGIAINPGTQLESVFPVLEDVDLVLVMSVNPGFGGQSFISRSLDRLSRLRVERERRGLDFRIEVDGGISAETAGNAVQAGAEWLVSGSAIFKHDNGIEQGIADLRQAIQSSR